MAEPIAIEESSLPESRNFICGVVEGVTMENNEESNQKFTIISETSSLNNTTIPDHSREKISEVVSDVKFCSENDSKERANERVSDDEKNDSEEEDNERVSDDEENDSEEVIERISDDEESDSEEETNERVSDDGKNDMVYKRKKTIIRESRNWKKLLKAEKKKFKSMKNQPLRKFYEAALIGLNVNSNPWKRSIFLNKQGKEYPRFRILRSFLNQLSWSNFFHVSIKICSMTSFQPEQFRYDKMKILKIIIDQIMNEIVHGKQYAKLIYYFSECKTNENICNIARIIVQKLENVLMESKKDEQSISNKFWKTIIRGKELEIRMNNSQMIAICVFYCEVYNLNLINLQSILDIISSFIKKYSSNETDLICVSKMITICKNKMNEDINLLMEQGIFSYKIQWDEIYDSIEELCKQKKSLLSNRTYLLLSNVLILKDKIINSDIDELGDFSENSLHISLLKTNEKCKSMTREERKLEKEKRKLERKMRSPSSMSERTKLRIQKRAEKKLKKEEAKRIKLESKTKQCENKSKKKQPKQTKIESNKTENFAIPEENEKIPEEYELNFSNDPWKRGNSLVRINDTLLALNKLFKYTLYLVSNDLFKQLNDNRTTDTWNQVLDCIFVKGSSDTFICTLYAKLLRNLYGMIDEMKIDAEQKLVPEVDLVIDHAGENETCVEKVKWKRIFIENVDKNVFKVISTVDTILEDNSEGTSVDKYESITGSLFFVDELFNYGFIKLKIILKLCLKFLTGVNENKLEILCKLLTKSGENIEKLINNDKEMESTLIWREMFEILELVISKNELNLSKRIFFMLNDLVDLKNRNWKSKESRIMPNIRFGRKEQRRLLQYNETMNGILVSYYKEELRDLSHVESPWSRGAVKIAEENKFNTKIILMFNTLNERHWNNILNRFFGIKFPETRKVDFIADIVFKMCVQETKYKKMYFKFFISYCETNVKIFDRRKKLKNVFVKKLMDKLFDNIEDASINNNDNSKEKRESYKEQIANLQIRNKLKNICNLICEFFILKYFNLEVMFDLLSKLLDKCSTNSLICFVQIVSTCGETILNSISDEKKEHFLINFDEMFIEIENICANHKDKLTKYVYLRLTNVLILKERNFILKVNKIVGSRSLNPIKIGKEEDKPLKETESRTKGEKIKNLNENNMELIENVRKITKDIETDKKVGKEIRNCYSKDNRQGVKSIIEEDIVCTRKNIDGNLKGVPNNLNSIETGKRIEKEMIENFFIERKKNFQVKNEYINEIKKNNLSKKLLNLKITNNPWRRGEYKQFLSEFELTIMKSKSLLNKLTENNFNSIVNQFIDLDLNETNIHMIIEILFLKSVFENKYTELYARFVSAWFKQENLNEDKLNVLFNCKRLLIDRCINEIENIDKPRKDSTSEEEIRTISLDDDEKLEGSSDNIENENKNTDFRVSSELDTFNQNEVLSKKQVNVKKQSLKINEDSQQLDSSIEELINNQQTSNESNHQKQHIDSAYEKMLQKIISNGSCVFFGELFNQDIVELDFLFNICFYLLNIDNYNMLHLESLVKLISTCGKHVEKSIKNVAQYNSSRSFIIASSSSGASNINSTKNDSKNVLFWNSILKQIETKVSPQTKHLLSKRIYFLILDLLDLRNRNWEPKIFVVPTSKCLPKNTPGQIH